MQNSLTAVILAGGESNRFWPLGWSKPLMSFCGRTVLEHTCSEVAGLGIERVIVITNPNDESEVRRLEIPDLTVETVIQSQAKGMGDAVLSAQNLIGGSPCLVLNAPDLVDSELYKQIKQSIGRKDNFVVGKKVDTYFDGGYLMLSDTRVTGVIEKPGKGKEPSSYIELVFNYFENIDDFMKILERTSSRSDDAYEISLTAYLADHESYLLPYEGFWQALKYPWHVLDFMKYHLSKIRESHGKPEVMKSNVVIEGPVVFESGVKIFENSKIVGPCYIEKDVVIGNNCIVRESQIGQGSVIGFNSDVTRSYLGKNCWLHTNYIGDSVLSDNVSMGSGAVLANLRLDEEEIQSSVKDVRVNTARNKLGACIGPNVRIGVQTSIMPGAKIGKNSFVGSGIVIDKDIPNDSFCGLSPGSFVITKNRKSLVGKNRDSYKKLL